MELALVLVAVIAMIGALSWAIGLFVHRYLRDDIGRTARWLLGLLAAQFVLGMAANLFQQIPKVMPWVVFQQMGPLAFHALCGLLIIIGAVWIRILAGKQKRYVPQTAVGGSAVAVAFVCGIIFVDFGQNDWYSFAMALGFLVALYEYSYIAYRTLNHK